MFLGLLTLLAGVLSAQTNGLPFRPISAEYSNALDRIIMTSANPSELHILNPATRADVKVALSKPPLSLSVSPDGLRAAVGHEFLISYVNLSSGTVEKTLSTTFPVAQLALGPEWVHATSPNTGPGAPSFGSVRISSGASVVASGFLHSMRLHPGGRALYASRDPQSPIALVRFDVSTGPITEFRSAVNHDSCGPVWFSNDGTPRIFDGCATVHSTSETANFDMVHLASPFNASRIGAFAQAGALGRILVIPQQQSTPDSTTVLIHDSASLRPIGTLRIPRFEAASSSYAGRGKWVFVDRADTSAYVIYQADQASGLLLDYALQRYPLVLPPACSVTPAATVAAAAYTGGKASVSLTAAADCVYQASTQTSWITLVSGAYGSGDGTLTYLVRPNTTNAARTGTISIGSHAIAITQEAAPATLPPNRRTGYSIVDAEYAKPQDRIVFVTSGPDELHVYNPDTGADQFVSLQRTPLSVSVRPDGLYAAVGHEGWLSYFNLRTLALERSRELPVRAEDVVLANNGLIYAAGSQTYVLYKVAVDSGAFSPTPVTSGGNNALRLHPSGNYLLVIGSGISKYDIRQGYPQQIRVAEPACQNAWAAEDGLHIFTGCGAVLRSSEAPQEDFLSNGTLSAAIGSVQWADHASAQRSTAVLSYYASGGVAADEIQLYEDASLQLRGRLRLPNFPGSSAQSHGTSVFWRSDASALHVILQAAPVTAAGEAALARITPGEITGCIFSVSPTSANIAGAGGTVPVTVTTGSNCLWTASNRQLDWVSISTYAATGSRSLTIQISPNDRTTSRSASVRIADQPITITQAGATPNLTLNSYSTNVPAGGGTSVVYASSNVLDYAWTVTSNASWITAQASLLSNTFPVNLTIQPNTGASRSGSVSVGDQTFVVIQAGTGAATGLRFVPVVPCRILDTRLPTGAFGGPRLTAGTPRDIAIPQGGCAIPSSAQAYALNVTVVPRGPLGFLMLWPSGQARPLASTLNSLDGRVVANAAIVSAGADGAVRAFATDDTDIIVDIAGYFSP